MSEVKLKPCPFCGGITTPTVMDKKEASWEYCDKDHEVECPEYVVCCAAKKGGCGTSTGFCDEPEQAINAWNTRYTENPSEINENAPNSGGNNSDK